jgi:molybdenum cofactor guanylyltransferase
MTLSIIPIHRRVAGVVLAGGKSSRMGANKALLPYLGKPMIEHIMNILRGAGCAEVFISGIVPGYEGIADEAPFEGPALAINSLLAHFRGKYDAVLFMPVDMPLMTPEALKQLLFTQGLAYYAGHPLPVVLDTCIVAPACKAVYQLLEQLKASAIELPQGMESVFANINTKEEWEALVS